MKLLGWMHRKFKQNSSDQIKDFVIGQTAGQLDHDQVLQYNDISKANFKHFKQAQVSHDQQNRKSFACSLEDYEMFDQDDREHVSISDLFHGFLAIGTLGSNNHDQQTMNVMDPLTPKFSISLDNITEKETEVTDHELRLINDELEKVLVADHDDMLFNEYSSGRNSLVSNGRSSHGSTITLSGKPMIEGIPESNNGMNTTTLSVCPLQEYLFGSAVHEFSETSSVNTTNAAGVLGKKENRTSLGELFQKSKMEEKRAEKDADKSAAILHLVKKILRKRALHANNSRASVDDSNGELLHDHHPSSAETKLHKILHMFQRKVHPESSIAMKKSSENNYKQQKNEKKIKKTMFHDDLDHEDIMIYSQTAAAPSNKSLIQRYKATGQFNPQAQFILSSTDSNGNREQWIKTDADYLVLEL